MIRALIALVAVVACATSQGPSLQSLARGALSQIDGAVRVAGLKADVHVLRDQWGVPHIYAQSTEDLFFAQGYVIAQDRLWQMEMWRRGAEGRLAEVLGAGAVARDRQTRLLRYRGAVDDRELTTYHPEARRIMTSYVAGVNAFIRDATKAGKLPVEFVLTGITPEPWTVETLVLRQTTFGDASAELQLARSVAQLGAAEANRRRNHDPFEELVVPEGLDVKSIDDTVVVGGGRGGTPRPQILPQYASLVGGSSGFQPDGAVSQRGSNNWVVSGAMSVS